MRKWIEILEAAVFGQSTYWYNPADDEVIPASDHGDAVMSHPDRFGVEWDIVSQMEEAWPYGSDENEWDGHDMDIEEHEAWLATLPEPPAECGTRQGNDRNNCWEVLGMNRGWVRVGHATKYSAAYFSSSTPEAIWRGVKFAAKNDGVSDKIEIELCPPGGEGGKFMYLDGEQLERYIKRGPRAVPFT